ncbi:hypothetical protein KQX54_018685 [Cotesia glomerata]|uniref:Uncharacterized protein n=1 Tax=Cotesia glomerata TaxID=32391 RepID=A0AAV7I9D2_COTGL|nr:hypothetical protein KQX54_018685 [Cotesia glomerata]
MGTLTTQSLDGSRLSSCVTLLTCCYTKLHWRRSSLSTLNPSSRGYLINHPTKLTLRANDTPSSVDVMEIDQLGRRGGGMGRTRNLSFSRKSESDAIPGCLCPEGGEFYSGDAKGKRRGRRSSVKPLIMPKQYTVGAPVSVTLCPQMIPAGLAPSPIKIFQALIQLEFQTF